VLPADARLLFAQPRRRVILRTSRVGGSKKFGKKTATYRSHLSGKAGRTKNARSPGRRDEECPGAPCCRASLSHNAHVLLEGDLPPGYHLRKDTDLLVLLRPDGSEVAEFVAGAADPLEVTVAAWEDSGLTSLSACRMYSWVTTDEEAVLEELMWKLGEASRRLRASRRLLQEHAMMDAPRPEAGGAAV